MRRAVTSTLLLFVSLAACGAPPPRSELLSSPITTPFGAAGVPDIPPRPSPSPPIWYEHAGPTREPPPRSWRDASDATNELSEIVPGLRSVSGRELRPVYSSSPCPDLARTFAIDDLAAVYEALKRDLDAAGFVRIFDFGVPLDGRYRDRGGIFLAQTSSLEARIYAGRYDPQMWAEGSSVARPYVVRLEIEQRCRP